MVWLLFAGCTSSDNFDSDSVVGSEHAYFLIDQLSFSRIDEMISWGFDIDGEESDAGDAAGCFHQDWVDPLGNTGIDNALGALAPILALTEASAVESIIEEHIRNGSILLVLEWKDDVVHIIRGTGSPLVGTDGRLLDGQSMGYERDPLASIMLEPQENTWFGHDFTVELQFSVLSNDILFDLQEGGLRLQREEKGVWGILAGKIPIERLLVIANDDQVGPNEIFVDMIQSAADIDPNEEGKCQFFSASFEFRAVPVFLNSDF